VNDLLLKDTHRRGSDKSFTLLCIDDETVNLKVLASIFKEHYRVVVSKSAKQGLLTALEVLPDLILLDVLMPDEDGFELLIKLKAHPELHHIPVIFITGLHSNEDEEKGLTLGACDYIQKPFNYGIVRARVNTHLEIIRQRILLEKFAHFDSLTELPNRRKWLSDSAEQWQFALQQKHPLVLGIVDIDFFKKYNDRYGHQQGDIVLRRVSNAIRRLLYKNKGDLYRCGGEEFYFYLVANDQINIATLLEQCLDRVFELEISHKDSLVSPFISISIGAIQVEPSAVINLDCVMKYADNNLYQVKNSTRNAVNFTEISNPNELSC
jgi:diguanylate cyclase (GGDEF)-like protein